MARFWLFIVDNWIRNLCIKTCVCNCIQTLCIEQFKNKCIDKIMFYSYRWLYYLLLHFFACVILFMVFGPPPIWPLWSQMWISRFGFDTQTGKIHFRMFDGNWWILLCGNTGISNLFIKCNCTNKYIICSKYNCTTLSRPHDQSNRSNISCRIFLQWFIQ